MYVGSSIQTNYRWNQSHRPKLRKGNHQNNHLQNAWNKYGEENFEHIILEECEESELEEREGHWIEHHKSWDRDYGYNLTRIIEGRKLVSQETRSKVSNHMKKRWKDEAYIKERSAIMSKTWEEQKDEIKDKLKDAWKRTRKKRAEAITEEGRKKMSEASKRNHQENPVPVLQFDLDGNLVKKWDGIRDAINKYGNHVCTVARGKRKTCGGYIWKYANEHHASSSTSNS